MKYIVLKNTYDRETKEPIKKGDVIELSDARAERGLKLGLIEVFETEKKEAKPKETEKKEAKPKETEKKEAKPKETEKKEDKKLDPKLETK